MLVNIAKGWSSKTIRSGRDVTRLCREGELLEEDDELLEEDIKFNKSAPVLIFDDGGLLEEEDELLEEDERLKLSEVDHTTTGKPNHDELLEEDDKPLDNEFNESELGPTTTDELEDIEDIILPLIFCFLKECYQLFR